MKAFKIKTNSNYYSKDDLNFNVKSEKKSNKTKEEVVKKHVAANYDSTVTILKTATTDDNKKDVCAFAPDIDFTKKKIS